MAELLGVDITIGGLWHAGSYDPQDFLGRLIGDKPWVRHAEQVCMNVMMITSLQLNSILIVLKTFEILIDLTEKHVKLVGLWSILRIA